MKKLLASLILLLTAISPGFGQTVDKEATTQTVTFRFVAGDDMFYIPWAGNGGELERLHALVDEYRTEIATGRMPVYVDGYCTSLPTRKENLRTAFVRANRVKSELITQKGLKEDDFITANYAEAYNGGKDLVVVTLRIPAPKAEVPQPPQTQPEPASVEVVPEPQPAPEKQPAPEPVAEQSASEPIARTKPYCFAVRTNVLYDALLLPTLGVEWRLNRDLGIKLDGSLAWWGGEHGKVQKMWLLNPEVRWYLLRDKRFYVGASANYGKYNIYKYALGGIMSKDTGYQGDLWGAGLTIGYQLYLSRRFSVDFNLGLGYTRSEYDSFRMIDGMRVYKDRNQSKNFWGPTQAGISLVWTIGGNK